jgi:glycine/D-amino acid oxidase-like deaminating enzyme
MPQTERFETLVLGGGNGGMYLAWHMGRSGRRTAVVERRWIGGSCPNINCLPSKNEMERESRRFGASCRKFWRDDGLRRDRHGQSPSAQARHGRRHDRPDFATIQRERRGIDHGSREFRGAENARGALGMTAGRGCW